MYLLQTVALTPPATPVNVTRSPPQNLFPASRKLVKDEAPGMLTQSYPAVASPNDPKEQQP